MRRVALLALPVLVVTCGPSPDAKLPDFPGLHGGTSGSGGVTESGGTSGGSGGSAKGGGGAGGSGGTTKEGTGGRTTGTGGRTTRDDAAVDARRDGSRGTGGSDGEGGVTTQRDAGRGTGGSGDAGRDLSTGRDLSIPGSGGMGGRDAPVVNGDSVAASCYAQIADNGYACGSAAPCSACKDPNGNMKEAECQKGIDCLVAAGPSCDSNCQLNCLNKAGDSPIQACIKALTTAACGGTGC